MAAPAAPRGAETARDLVTLVGNLRAVKDEPYTFAKSVMVSWCHDAADAISELMLERDEARAGVLTPDRTQAANAALTAQVAARDKRIAALEETLETTEVDVRWFSQNPAAGTPAERLAVDRLVRDHKRVLAFCAASHSGALVMTAAAPGRVVTEAEVEAAVVELGGGWNHLMDDASKHRAMRRALQAAAQPADELERLTNERGER